VPAGPLCLCPHTHNTNLGTRWVLAVLLCSADRVRPRKPVGNQWKSDSTRVCFCIGSFLFQPGTFGNMSESSRGVQWLMECLCLEKSTQSLLVSTPESDITNSSALLCDPLVSGASMEFKD
jgi:hypothetical protein